MNLYSHNDCYSGHSIGIHALYGLSVDIWTWRSWMSNSVFTLKPLKVSCSLVFWYLILSPSGSFAGQNTHIIPIGLSFPTQPSDPCRIASYLPSSPGRLCVFSFLLLSQNFWWWTEYTSGSFTVIICSCIYKTQKTVLLYSR